ncbi:hypothetical protein D3C85_1628470 [compost metagenome]
MLVVAQLRDECREWLIGQRLDHLGRPGPGRGILGLGAHQVMQAEGIVFAQEKGQVGTAHGRWCIGRTAEIPQTLRF